MPHCCSNNAANEIADITDGGSTWIDPVYDADGQMTSGPKPSDPTTRLHYAYDAWGRMVSVKADSSGSPGSTIATYAYDGLDRRITKTISGHAYDGYYNQDWQLLEVRIDGDTDAREQYVYDQSYIDQPIIRYFDSNNDGDYADANDNTLYYTTDANHNVTSLVNPSGSEVEHYVYDPYGTATVYDSSWSVLSGGTAVSNDVQFGGYKFDAETSFNYSRERYYNASTGTWQQRDKAGYVDGGNLYSYANNQTINNSDPSGMSSFGLHDEDQNAADKLAKSLPTNLSVAMRMRIIQDKTASVSIYTERGYATSYDNPIIDLEPGQTYKHAYTYTVADTKKLETETSQAIKSGLEWKFGSDELASMTYDLGVEAGYKVTKGKEIKYEAQASSELSYDNPSKTCRRCIYIFPAILKIYLHYGSIKTSLGKADSRLKLIDSFRTDGWHSISQYVPLLSPCPTKIALDELGLVDGTLPYPVTPPDSK